MKRAVNSPLRKTMCATCPFRKGSRYAALAHDLAHSAQSDSTRICHSTGSNAINQRTGIKPHICRGARDLQLRMFFNLEYIAAPTDEAWNVRRVKQGFQPTITQDPPEKK